MLARNEYFRDLAREYLAGVTSENSNRHPLDLSPNTGFAKFSVAGLRTNHVQDSFFSNDTTTSTENALLLGGDFSYLTWNRLGSVGYHYQTNYQRNAVSNSYHRWNNSIEVPIALHVAQAKDIIFRPIFSYQTLAGKPFNFTYGVGVKGAVYQDHYVQSVQALLYTDHIFVAKYSPEAGAHYRFEYAWDFYPKNWFISSLVAIEHVSAGSPTSYLGKVGTFEMSHNDFILDFKFDREFSKFTFGIDPRLVARLDTNGSTYTHAFENTLVSKSREDWEIDLKANISMPIFPSVQLFAWYEWTKVFSNFGHTDYVNRNFTNQTLGLGLKTSLSTY